MERPVSIHEMETVAGGLGGDFSVSNDIGNIIEISDTNDSLGLGMLANPGRQRGQQQQQSSSGYSLNHRVLRRLKLETLIPLNLLH